MSGCEEMKKLLLKVATEEYAQVGKLNAIWDENLKLWYLDNFKNFNVFKKWLPIPEATVFCNKLYIFTISRECWRSHRDTLCVCLATDDSYIIGDKHKIEQNNSLLLFSDVKEIPARLLKYLAENYQYRLDFSKQTQTLYYINHCSHCGASQGDYYLHKLPETSFYQSLCYKEFGDKNQNVPSYYELKNQYLVPINAPIPYYDEWSSSFELLLLHMQTEVENWASLNINQKKVNTLLKEAKFLGSINI